MTAKNPLPPTVRARAYGARYRPPNARRAGAELSLDELASARKAVAEVILRRIRCCEPVSNFPHLLNRLDDLLVIGSTGGTETGSGGAELDLCDAAESARHIGCSQEWVRRIAPRLGGQFVGGSWVFPRQNVIQHALGRELGDGRD